MTFRVGQKVVCIKTRSLLPNAIAPWNRHAPLVKGAVYTISGFEHRGGSPGIYLVEAKSNLPPFGDGGERSFDPSRFRPIVERKTDISIFTKMLTPEGVDA